MRWLRRSRWSSASHRTSAGKMSSIAVPMKGVWPPGSSISVRARLARTMQRLVSSVATPLGMVSSMVSSSRRRASRVALAAESWTVGGLDGAAAAFEVGGHVVEAADELAELFGGAFGDAMGVVSGGDRLHGVGQRFDGLGDLLGEMQRQPAAGEEREAGHHQQQQHVEVAHLAALTVGVPVVVDGGLKAGHGGGHAVGHGQADDDGAALLDRRRDAERIVGTAEGEDGQIGCAGRRRGWWRRCRRRRAPVVAGRRGAAGAVLVVFVDGGWSGSQGLTCARGCRCCGMWKAATGWPSR